MATGIVSVAADDHHYRLISDVLAAVRATGLAVLMIVAARTRWDDRDPDVTLRLFTFVAACAVLGARLRAQHAVLWMLAALGWLVLAALAVRNMKKRGWVALRDQARGGWELASVATSGIAIVTAELTMVTRSTLLFALSAAMWVLAVAVYCAMTSLIVRAVAAGVGFRPERWILMGGLAIASLAGAQVHAAAVAVDSPLAAAGPPITVVTWAVATAWIPVLVYAQGRADAPRIEGPWWAAVFPLGMYSAATQATALEMRWPVLTTVSLVFFWIALAAWLVAAISSVLSRP
jgi:hypothetical protein